jgi:hypothetical protein
MAKQELSDFQLDEMAAEAKNLQNSKVLQLVFERLEADYVAKLKAANIGDLTVPTLHASMKALEDVKGHIKNFITDAQFRRLK